MQKFNISGMSCAACSARVEKAVSELEGVDSCSVNLLTNSMEVKSSISDEEIILAVKRAGYGASALSEEGFYSSSGEKNTKRKTDEGIKRMRSRFFISLAFLLVLMYVAMGHMMWGLPLPAVIAESHLLQGAIQLVLALIIAIINRNFFISGAKAAFRLSPNMDTLVSLGSGASFIYSIYVLVAMAQGDSFVAHDLYFESAAMILVLVTLGKMLEAIAKGKTTDALDKLIELAPQNATVVRDGKEISIPIKEVKRGDVFVVRPGESIPVDGIILEGESALDESALTGESIPVDKTKGAPVYSATINQSGFLRCEATNVGEDTSLSKIIKMVSDASASKAPIAKIADKVSGIFVPVVIVIAIISFTVWLLLGERFGFALARGISVLVISCPCALGLATPVSIMVGNGLGAKGGILFKNATSLEEAGKIKIAVLDKTGTITRGMPEVTDIVCADGISENELLALAFSLEKQSEHPLAKAIVKYGEEKQTEIKAITGFKALSGNGLIAAIDGKKVFGGSKRFISESVEIPKALEDAAERLAESGKTPMFFAKEDMILGMIAVADVIKEESPFAIKELRKMGIHTVMLTGDNEKTAGAIAKAAGIDEVIAGVLPDGKERVIRELQGRGKVAMVGDGINDAPALTAADTGIAIGSGTDIAIDSADIILMKSNLSDLPAAIKLSRATLRNIHWSLFWAFFYNSVGIPLAAGVLIPIGLTLNPMFAATAMSLSSVCVVSNALRLNLFNMYKSEKSTQRRKRNMTKTIKIEGMMCMHCEAHVKRALEALDGVVTAEPNHKDGIATVTLSCDVSDTLLKGTVENQGYKVISIK